jgi:hypothetical protein
MTRSCGPDMTHHSWWAVAVAAGFGPELAAAIGRRVGLGLLAIGPLVGTTWLLLAATTWRWARREPPAGWPGRLPSWPPGRVRCGSAWPAGLLAAVWPPAQR